MRVKCGLSLSLLTREGLCGAAALELRPKLIWRQFIKDRKDQDREFQTQKILHVKARMSLAYCLRRKAHVNKGRLAQIVVSKIQRMLQAMLRDSHFILKKSH